MSGKITNEPGEYCFFAPSLFESMARKGRQSCLWRVLEPDLESWHGWWQSHQKKAESWTWCLAGVKEGSCPLTPGDAQGMQQGFRKPGDGSGGQLISLCLSGHGAEHSGFCPAWCGDRRVARAARVGVDMLCSAPGPFPGWSHLAVPARGSQGLQGWCCGCCPMDSPGSPVSEGDLSLQGGSINPFWSRSQFSCQGNTLGAAQGLCKGFASYPTCLWPGAVCQGLAGVGSTGSVPMHQWGPGPASQILPEILHKCLGVAVGAQPLLGDL